MDILFDLPKTKQNKTVILVVVDKLSKQAHFIPLEPNHNAENTADVFYKEICRLQEIPRRNISDRDSRFKGTFWTILMKILQVKLNISSAFHPQTDGQFERAFRTIEEMLRCFIGKNQNEWDKLLPGLEFAYNNYVNETTKYSPFFLAFGQNPF